MNIISESHAWSTFIGEKTQPPSADNWFEFIFRKTPKRNVLSQYFDSIQSIPWNAKI